MSACSGGASGSDAMLPQNANIPIGDSGTSPIQHIVVIVQENRSFNNLFAQFPNATGTITGKEKIGKGKNVKVVPIALTQVTLEDKQNLNHLYKSYKIALDNGKMDAFNRIIFQSNGQMEGKKPYQYVRQSDIQPYWDMATQYALANKMFQTQGSGSFTAHQDLIRGGTEIDTQGDSLVDDPDNAKAWGCDSPAGTTTSLIKGTTYKANDGPFPCTKNFPTSGVNYTTLRDLLDAKGVSWKYYVPQLTFYQPGAIWNAFDVIAPVRYGSEWGTNVDWPEKNILTDIPNGQLPAVSWVIPDEANSDHPGYASDTGPSWVTSVVNAVGESSYWNSTVVVVLWDDWGGFYDPVSPPKRDKQGGPGFRVPAIVISPYSIAGDISQTVYGFGSVVRYIEDTFDLGRLGTTDATSKSIANMLNYNQNPRAFKPITSKYPRAFFIHQKPSGLPVDTE
ncbi:MAG TPA: alkaline phosphatase family protein [Candidatus Cybelea sp.]|jgi:phospholipase C|nr:alkaline phosphatase family protein [Candidatus Cybelea sp.]